GGGGGGAARGADRVGVRAGGGARRAADRGGQPVRGQPVRGRRRGAAAAGELVAAAQPAPPVLGRAVPGDRAPDAGRDPGCPEGRGGARGGAGLAPVADLDGAPGPGTSPALARPSAPAGRP